ncbi:MAG TPA: prepilin-type N-terminal cleavage/methylation domain-containing protein [Luteimonas sp.]|nr:prepilin-type N-terminal cleavage/methylation domain-containing protein [Luteimonas sp.]
MSRRQAMAGFSLVELMVGLVLGLILLGSVLALVAANLQNNAQVVRDMRTTQESRALTEVMARELRRNGFIGDSLRLIGSGETSDDFPQVEVLASDCIAYGYDANANGVLDAGEHRLFSRGVVDGRGAVFRKLTTTAATVFAVADCGTGDQISSDDIDVECLGFVAPDAGDFSSSTAAACYDVDPGITITHPDGSLFLALRVSLVADPEISRRTEMQVSIRSPEIPTPP